MDPFLCTILLWPANYPPRGWLFCAGQLLSISQNTALFALLGTTYGGDGQTTFGLPDFRGRVPVGAGNGIGLSPYTLGQSGGTENYTLTTAQMPAHTHIPALSVTLSASNAQATASVPAAGVNTLAAPYDGGSGQPINGYNNATPTVPLNTGATSVSGTISMSGGSIPFPILQPYLAVNYIIALVGAFPPRD